MVVVLPFIVQVIDPSEFLTPVLTQFCVSTATHVTTIIIPIVAIIPSAPRIIPVIAIPFPLAVPAFTFFKEMIPRITDTSPRAPPINNKPVKNAKIPRTKAVIARAALGFGW